MATLSSISLHFVSLCALVVALASSGSALPSAFHGGGGSVSILDACGGVTITCGSFSGSFALFDGDDVPTIDKGVLPFSSSYLDDGDAVGFCFPSAGFIADVLVHWPALLEVAAMGYSDLGWPLVGGWLWKEVMAARVFPLLTLDLGFFSWAYWSLVLGLGLGFIFYFCFCYLSVLMNDGVSASSD